MEQRILYLAAYDIVDDGRLRRALHVVRDYATGGQKSVFECFLTTSERRALLARMQSVIDESEDRFLLIRLSRRRRTRVLGKAVQPRLPRFFYFG